MYGENVIGKKVNLLEGYGFCSKKMTDEELRTSTNNSYMFTDGTPR